MKLNQTGGYSNAGSAFLGKTLQKSIYQSRQSLGQSLQIFEDRFRADPDAAIASVLIHRFDAIDYFAAMTDFSSATREFEYARVFLCDLLDRPDLQGGQYEAITRGSRRLQSEWSAYVSYGHNFPIKASWNPLAYHKVSCSPDYDDPRGQTLH